MVMGKFGCSCFDYHLNVVIRGRRSICYHIAAVLISEENNSFGIIEHKDPEFIGFVKQMLSSDGLGPDP